MNTAPSPSRTINLTAKDHANREALLPSDSKALRQRNEKLSNAKAKLNASLQTSLNSNTLFQLFFEELGKLIELQGIQYHSPDQSLQINLGHQDLYCCSYRIINAQEFIGELVLYRNSLFNEYHMELIEILSGSLVHPLTNALLYNAAVTASLTDPLTGIGNRAALDRHLQREIELASRHGSDLSLLLMDIDDFKAINDKHGHSAGDVVLKTMTNELRKLYRQTDLCFRFGGEEFVLVLNKTSLTNATLIAERMRRTLEETTLLSQQKKPVTVSIGCIQASHTDTTSSLLDRADSAMYQAKQQGKNQVVAQ